MNEENFNEQEFNEAFDREFEKKKKEVDDLFAQKLVISLIGDVNVGKSSTINALTGKKLSEVGNYAGLTTEVHPFEYDENVIIADTPGLSDINEKVSEKATDYVHKDADIILFFFNAAVGPTKPLVDMFKALKKLNKPIISIINKSDIMDDEEKKVMIDQIKATTGQIPIAISAKKNQNIDELNTAIYDILEKSGKELLFLKVSKYKESKVKVWINGASAASFGVGIIPIPGADVLPLTGIQTSLAFKIAYIYNCKVSKEDIMSLIGSTITSGLGKQLFKWGIQGLKAMGWLGGPFGATAVAALAGTIAASITYGFGWVCNAYYKSGMEIELGELGEIYKAKYKEYYERNKKHNDPDNPPADIE